jgi:hypothetical protein
MTAKFEKWMRAQQQKEQRRDLCPKALPSTAATADTMLASMKWMVQARMRVKLA